MNVGVHGMCVDICVFSVLVFPLLFLFSDTKHHGRYGSGSSWKRFGAGTCTFLRNDVLAVAVLIRARDTQLCGAMDKLQTVCHTRGPTNKTVSALRTDSNSPTIEGRCKFVILLGKKKTCIFLTVDGVSLHILHLDTPQSATVCAFDIV